MRKIFLVAAAAIALSGCAALTPAEKINSDSPSWYMKPPADDAALFASGMAVSSDLQFAIDKAVLNAKAALADRVAGKISAVTKSHIAERGTAVSSSASKTIKNVVSGVDLAGYEVAESTVVPIGERFRVYVLLKYVPATDENADAAYKELERDTKAPDAPPPAASPRPEVKAVPM